MAKHETITVTLPAELLRTIEQLVAHGRVRDLEDVLVTGVEALTAEEVTREQRWVEYARERFAEGMAAEERGEAITITNVKEFMAGVRARVQARLRADAEDAANGTPYGEAFHAAVDEGLRCTEYVDSETAMAAARATIKEVARARESRWVEYARTRFLQGMEAEARGEAITLTSDELMARVHAGVKLRLAKYG